MHYPVVLSSKGFGPKDITIQLGTLNLIAGAVHTGKSTILNMVRFAVLGYIPSIGKLDAITARYMAGERMEVTLEINLPSFAGTFTRELIRDGDGFTKRLSASWANGKLKVVHPQILQRFGTHVDQIEQHLDQTQFLRLSADMRARAIDGMLAEGSTPAELGRECAKHTVLKLIGIDADSAPDDWRELIPRLSDGDRALLEEYQPLLKRLLKDSGIGGVIDDFSAKVSKEDKTQKERRAAAKELAADAAELGTVQEDEIEQLESIVSELDQKIGAWNAKRPDVDEHDRQLGKLQRELAALRNESDEGATPEQKESLEAARTALVEAEETLAGLEEPAPQSVEAAQAKIDGLQRDLEKIEEEKDPDAPTDEEIAEATQAHTRAEEKVETLERSPWGEVAKVQESLTAKATELKGKRNMKDVREFITEQAMALAKHCSEQTKKLEAGRAEVKTTGKKLDELSGPWRTERDRKSRENDTREKLNQAKQSKRDIETKNKSAREDYDSAVSAVNEAKNEVTRIETEIAQADSKAAGLSGRIQAKEEEIEKLSYDVTDDPGEPTDLQTARDEAAERLAALRDAKSKLDQIAKKEREIEQAQARRTVLVAFRDAAKRVGADEATKKRAPLIKIMSAFSDACGIADEPFFELGGDNPKIGVQRIGSPDDDPGLRVRTIDVSVLSGNEWGIFTAGLNIAMQQLRDVPVKVIPIEGGEIEGLGPDIVPLMKGLRAQRELFDCCLLTCHGIPDDVDDWNVIDVSQL